MNTLFDSRVVHELPFLASSDKPSLAQDPQVMRNQVLGKGQLVLDLAHTLFATTQQPQNLDALRFHQGRHKFALLLTCRAPVSTYVLCPTGRRTLSHVTTPIDSMYIDILCENVRVSRPGHKMMWTPKPTQIATLTEPALACADSSVFCSRL